jgi:ribose 5-phosphate isomerase B
MKIAIGCDEAAFALKEALKKFLVSKGHEVDDYGVYDETPVLYPDIAVKVCESITSGKNERGVLVCGTGIGMAITANKVPGSGLLSATTCSRSSVHAAATTARS